MDFLETGREWRSIPQWVEFLIRFGYMWRSDGRTPRQRKIAIISMPCDSAAAGLLALGAFIKDLGNTDANDIDGHYDAILRYAHQYISHCRNCELPECRPEVKHCGYTSKATGFLRSIRQPKKVFCISDRTDFDNRQIAWETPGRGNNGPVIGFPCRESVIDWHIEGESAVQVSTETDRLMEDIYQALIPGTGIILDNLERSYSGLCFSGRATGEVGTHKACDTIHFRDGDTSYRLSELLTVKGWSLGSIISRMTYFNPRTRKLNRAGSSPELVVADGDISLLRVLARSEFQQSDVIGVMQRTLERDRLEAVGAEISSLRQWYTDDPEFMSRLTGSPRGINFMVLKRGNG